jgi:hypothetical protein
MVVVAKKDENDVKRCGIGSIPRHRPHSGLMPARKIADGHPIDRIDQVMLWRMLSGVPA